MVLMPKFDDDGNQIKGEYWVVDKAVYGLREAPFLWHKLLNKTLTTSGWTPLLHAPTLYTKGKHSIVTFVDDIAAAGPQSKNYLVGLPRWCVLSTRSR